MEDIFIHVQRDITKDDTNTDLNTQKQIRKTERRKAEEEEDMHPKAGFVQKSIFNSLANVYWVLLAFFSSSLLLWKSLH